MPRRLLRAVTARLPAARPQSTIQHAFSVEDVVWAMGSFCALNRKPFDGGLLIRQFPPPYNTDSFIHAGRALGFRIKRKDCASATVATLNFPCLAVMHAPVEATEADTDVNVISDAPVRTARPAIVVQVNPDHVILFEAGNNTPKTLTHAEFEHAFAGTVFELALDGKAVNDPDGARQTHTTFGFNWFIPELLKHGRVWRDVLIASLIIQLLALGTPLFTQVVIDKVVVHRTESTLIVIAIGTGEGMLEFGMG